MRSRPTSVLILLALAGVSLSPAPSAHAATPICEGKEATITGPTPGGGLTGTPGNDVIVTQGEHEVRSLGGDDLICVTGPESYVNVSAGDGDDRVHNQTDGNLSVILGPGDDSFVGGPGHDSVGIDGFTDDLPTGSSGHDVISTGAGNDRVATAAPGEPSTDIIDLGDGDDHVRISPTAGDKPTLAGGDGTDSMSVEGEDIGSWAVDNVGEHLSRDGAKLATWASFETFHLYVRGPQSFVGGPANESAHFETADRGPVHVSMGAGDDTIGVSFWGDELTPGSTLSGGPGGDRLSVNAAARLTLDLPGDSLTIGSTQHEVSEIEDASLLARRIELRGNAGPNRLHANGCQLTVRGGGGADVLTTTHGQGVEGRLCPDLRAGDHLLYGQGGDDRLIGGSFRDQLLGGAGRDYANGKGGRDVCRAERERQCER